MLRYSILICLVLFTVSCGQRSEDSSSVYDTAANPSDFPEQACTLIDQVEAGQLATFDLITESFNRLYTNHPDLLDNAEWRAVIDRLGPEFRRRADELASRGLTYFGQAAGFYTLAAFANPDDVELNRTSRLFEGWNTALANLSRGGQDRGSMSELRGMLAAVRELYVGDSLQQAFLETYNLQDYLWQMINDPAGKAALDQLPSADQAFLAVLDFGPPPASTVATWENARVKLLAYRFVPIVRGQIRCELYFSAQPGGDAELFPALCLGEETPVGGFGYAQHRIERNGRVVVIADVLDAVPAESVWELALDISMVNLPEGAPYYGRGALIPDGQSTPWVRLERPMATASDN